MLGPVLGHDFSESVQVVERLLSGRVPGLPRLGIPALSESDASLVLDLSRFHDTEPMTATDAFPYPRSET